MIILEILQNFLCTEGIRDDDRLQYELLNGEWFIVVQPQQEVPRGDGTYKFIDYFSTGKNLAVFGLQQIVNDIIPAFVDVHPLHIGTVCHKMNRTFIGEVEHLFVDDVLFSVDHPFVGSGLQHGTQFHF